MAVAATRSRGQSQRRYVVIGSLRVKSVGAATSQTEEKDPPHVFSSSACQSYSPESGWEGARVGFWSLGCGRGRATAAAMALALVATMDASPLHSGRSRCRDWRLEWVALTLEAERKASEDPAPEMTQAAGELRRSLGLASLDGKRERSAQLRANLLGQCDQFYRHVPGAFYEFETRDPRSTQETRAALAVRVAEYQLDEVLKSCHRDTVRLEELQRAYAEALVGVRDLEVRADPNVSGVEARGHAESVTSKRQEAARILREADELDASIRVRCGSFGEEILGQLEEVQMALEMVRTVAPPADPRIHRAAELATAKDEIRTCLDECQDCLDGLDQSQEELGLLVEDLGRRRYAIADKRAEVERLSDEYADARARARTHLYLGSQGELFVAAARAGQAEGRHLGWIIQGEELEAVRVARRFQRRSFRELAELEESTVEVENQIVDLRGQLERNLPVCEDARILCQRELVELKREQESWLKRLRDDGTIHDETSRFAAAAIEVRRLVHRAVVRASRILDKVTPLGPVELIPEVAEATPLAAWGVVAGWGPAHRKAAAATLEPYVGAYLALPEEVLHLDRGSLEVMSRGEILGDRPQD